MLESHLVVLLDDFDGEVANTELGHAGLEGRNDDI